MVNSTYDAYGEHQRKGANQQCRFNDFHLFSFASLLAQL